MGLEPVSPVLGPKGLLDLQLTQFHTVLLNSLSTSYIMLHFYWVNNYNSFAIPKPACDYSIALLAWILPLPMWQLCKGIESSAKED